MNQMKSPLVFLRSDSTSLQLSSDPFIVTDLPETMARSMPSKVLIVPVTA